MSLLSKRESLFSYRNETRFLRSRQFNLERDILGIAYTLFEAEKFLKSGGKLDSITISLSEPTYQRIEIAKLRNILKELMLLILLEDITLRVMVVDDSKNRMIKPVEFPRKDAIILFSGGVDSYAGIKIAERRYRQDLLGLFVAHTDQQRIIGIVDSLKALVKTEIRGIYAPGMGSTGYSQLRGFVYILAAGAYASLCGSSKILVTECGPTMYQPLFSPYDSITYTTHPYVLKAAKEALRLLLGREIDIIIPFENLTKAEIIAASGLADFSATHSCISQRFGDHDGTCFGCVIRRLACLVNGVQDVKYRTDIFGTSRYFDNLAALLSFSSDILNDFQGMPYFEVDKIFEFDKQDLFRRYALDNLAGFMLGTKNRRSVKAYAKNLEALAARVPALQERKNKPDFAKLVE